jgi:hypothetical protein
VIPIEPNIIKTWLDAKEAARLAEKNKKETEQVLLTALGDAEAADCGLGRLTYFEQTRKEYVVPASSYRVPRFKQNRVNDPRVNDLKEATL